MKKNRKSDAIDRELRALAALPDDEIDLSDIPEISEEQFRRGIRGLFYRPLKKPVTIRLDVDIIEWLKKDGRGYQTKANALLRREMMRSLTKKSPARAVKGRDRRRSGSR